MPKSKNSVVVPKKLLDKAVKQTKGNVVHNQGQTVGSKPTAKQQPRQKGKKRNQPQQVIHLPLSSGSVSTMTVKCTLNTASLELAFVSLASWICQKGLVSNTTTTGVDMPWQSIFHGLTFALRSTGSMIQGGATCLSQMPKVIADLIAALSPKEVPFMGYSKVAYGWNEFDPSKLNLGPVDLAQGTWVPTYAGPDDNEGPMNPGVVWVGQGDGSKEYSQLLKLLSGLDIHKELRIVSSDYKSPLRNDVSAFARSYAYCGHQVVPTGGFWKDLESEVNITAPMYANFVTYDTPDERLPRRITPGSCDAAFCLTGPLNDYFTTHFNKCPPVQKQIDFEHIYTYLCLYMVKLKEAACASIGGGESANTPLPFSAQSFRIALRQALLTVFQDQPLIQTGGTVSRANDSNCFVGFQVNGTTWGDPYFANMKVPSIFAENLAALTTRQIRYGKSKHNAVLYIPILGRYIQDERVYPSFRDGGREIDLFMQPDSTELNIDLIDGSSGSSTFYVDLNSSYYRSVMDNWNYTVDKLSSFSVPTQSLPSDKGPAGEGILYYTRLIKTGKPFEESVAPKNPYILESLKNCVNNGIKKTIERPAMVKQDSKSIIPRQSKTEVTMLNPASVLYSDISTTTCVRPLIPEEKGLYDTIIVPSARLTSGSNEDVLSEQMYVTATGEATTTSYSSRSNGGGGVGVWSRLDAYAGMCVHGLAGHNDSMYIKTFEHLQELNKAGALSALLGGIAKSIFPGAGGIIDTISQVLPI